MEDKFEVVCHYGGHFDDFNHNGYYGLESTWLCDPDYWCYFEIIGNLDVLGYKEEAIDSIWFYEPYMADEMVLLDNDNRAKRVQSISQTDGQAHIYIVHKISQPEIIEMIEYYGLDEYNMADENGPTDNVGPTVDEVTNDGVGPTEVERENETFGPTIVEVEIEKGGKESGGSGPFVGEDVVGPDVSEHQFGPTVSEEETGQVVDENVSKKEVGLGDKEAGEKNVTGCDKEVSGVGKKNDQGSGVGNKNDKGKEPVVEEEDGFCFELYEDSDVDSAQDVHFGDSDVECMLNDWFDFDEGSNGDEGVNGDEGANHDEYNDFEDHNENINNNVTVGMLQPHPLMQRIIL